MCEALKNEGQAFGGVNMIFAGDFALLPPFGKGHSLYSHTAGTVIHHTNSYKDQTVSMGKALWHQVTTVVILRENMRQREQNPEDAKLCTALDNLRYKSCTDADIKHIQGRVAGRAAGSPKLNQPRFRNVSVITARNTYRDRINELGCERFAAENNQTLHTFYSSDCWSTDTDDRKSYRQQTALDPKCTTNEIDPVLQQKLWDLPPASSEHHAGKLTLCIGLPIMIKANEATECCVTNGAEGIVVGWKSRLMQNNKHILETVFVKLTSPPVPVQLDGLPENVVPVSQHGITVKYEMQNDQELKIKRYQVPILPNFAITDYGSQGRTRPNNVCDLQNCKNHQSIYTCLSRGSTYEGTIIVQGFDPRKMTGGLSGYLRQELRELELLDEITKLRYLQTLPANIQGSTCNSLIHSFRQWKGAEHAPKGIHSELCWSASKPFLLEDPSEESEWTILHKPKKKKGAKGTDNTDNAQNMDKGTPHKSQDLPQYIPAQGTQQRKTISKDKGQVIRKRKGSEQMSPANKKHKSSAPSSSQVSGLNWHPSVANLVASSSDTLVAGSSKMLVASSSQTPVASSSQVQV